MVNSPVHTLKDGLCRSPCMPITGADRPAPPASQRGWKVCPAGYLIAFLGTLLIAGDWWFENSIAPEIAAVVLEVMSGAITGSMAVGVAVMFGLFAVGGPTSGIATFRANEFPRPAAALLIVVDWSGFLQGAPV